MKYIYLIQTNTNEKKYELPKNSDKLILNWGLHPLPDTSIYMPNCTWMEGRNELFRRAIIQNKYDYFIFLDDDLSIPAKNSGSRSYRELIKSNKKSSTFFKLKASINYARDVEATHFEREEDWFVGLEKYLNDFKPMVATGFSINHPWDSKHRSAREVDCVSYGDHGCIAIHASAALQLLPYDTVRSKRNWWLSSEDFHRRACEIFPKRVMRFNRLTWVNSKHREYPNDLSDWVLPENTVTKPSLKPAMNTPLCYPGGGDVTGMPVEWPNVSIVITTISPPTEAVHMFSKGIDRSGASFVLVGDTKSPTNFYVPGARYLSIFDQLQLPYKLAVSLPKGNYARKNLGYLAALSRGASYVLETDDDNLPLPEFWALRSQAVTARRVMGDGWKNVYAHFSSQQIWPRGFPLENILRERPVLGEVISVKAPIQQGLAQYSPDVDAIYRMLSDKPVYFNDAEPLYLSENQWCPFNSQNTLWDLNETAALMYLPSTCTMRETDILRGYVAQRVLWTLGYGLLFHKANVIQDRNAHDLRDDYRQEHRLYLHADQIAKNLSELDLPRGREYIFENMYRCYEVLLRMGLVEPKELLMLRDWCDDLLMIARTATEITERKENYASF